MLIFLSIILLLAIGIFLFLLHPKSGKAPSGERLAKFQQSPNFKNGKFENFTFTPMFAEGTSMMGLLYDQLFKKHPDREPNGFIPSVKIDLHQLEREENILIWFGHSSYFMQIEGKRFLIDPVFSGNASPVPGSVKAFQGTDPYTVADIPEIDYLLITHDHYDHLDYETIRDIKHNVKKVICGLGVGSHLEYWGYASNMIIEKDWDQTIEFQDLKIHTAKARHFSGRTFSRNNTLWLSFVVETPIRKIYVGGDSGYDTHLAEIGALHGPIDLAILDNGQYNQAWRNIHFFPEETVKAALDLKAKSLMPVHSSKFALSMHPWYEPISEVYQFSKQYQMQLKTPIIGEKVWLDDANQVFTNWWEEVD
ncbi:MBL fold metallo-hydrolase [Shivajiella indica]|uniref:MBL fold metallo-hydrolase n=1 Tax=Shivajiella indica TaxID=872115 RepID=A0ABW5B640_9BACT